MIDYLELIYKEFPQASFSFKSGVLSVTIGPNFYYKKSVFNNTKRNNTLADVNEAFKNSYNNLQKIKSGDLFIKFKELINTYEIPLFGLHITDTGLKAINQFLNNMDGFVLDETKVHQFKSDVFPTYRNYYEKFVDIARNQRLIGNSKIYFSSMFHISLKGLSFYCRKPYGREFDAERDYPYTCSLTLPSVYYCTNIFHEEEQNALKEKDPAYAIYEKLFISYLYHINEIDKIIATLEYLNLNLDKKYPEAIVNKSGFSLFDLI